MRTYDFAAVGVGPFNLGLAALTENVPDLDGVFLDARPGFDWHPGLMIEGVTIQVPFLADLVTMADPTSRFSFLNYLKQVGRLYPFYIRENFFPLRAEYNAYCRWVAAQLPAIRWNARVDTVTHDGEAYLVHTAAETFRARRLVLGVGTAPHVPAVAGRVPHVHSADYLAHRDRLRTLGSITVVGSGQSAAEIYHDLLAGIDTYGYHLSWVTRSPRFFPMEYTKLTLEMTSPEYIRYHHGLPMATRDRLAREQRHLHKGISADLVDAIHERLYAGSLTGPVPTSLLTGVELTDVTWDAAAGRYTLGLHHREQDRSFATNTEGLVLATGYTPRVPSFLEPVRDRINWDARGRFDVAVDYSVDRTGKEIFVQNAEEHTHSLTAPDLGMGPYRNSVILRGLTGREVYPIEERIAFQEFGVPTRQLVTTCG
ncbi:lysine N6-hydroxylase [Actinoplanes sp. SE50]|uniref:lysine N(6)-hydroxylase/L-ornithine N(5)-oxygenase family protein n=1 Tax=unclassified Actinoplanes TaxID=2626549 RepID=UPI00023ED509|nr:MULTISPECIES: SidA/IucD/PvdA family monooxygenase [unclassified Actinoplanes]AEV87880.1 lysine N6-hydroxylase [Actinoplanes sp. SE50/110]ATO86284.1 lysine N6-hydroxylase [Actinoplanes sp. SE50]SLM03699.1 lysine N6-hydroxylase [Actinoplanes sp. SE50/110]